MVRVIKLYNYLTMADKCNQAKDQIKLLKPRWSCLDNQIKVTGSKLDVR